jgi:hypothetical protein
MNSQRESFVASVPRTHRRQPRGDHRPSREALAAPSYTVGPGLLGVRNGVSDEIVLGDWRYLHRRWNTHLLNAIAASSFVTTTCLGGNQMTSCWLA